jgi:predicted NAD/FAD-dependent oxidoreductase
MHTQDRTSMRIGIIGAGTSGLTAAHYLRRSGYERVTVLEQEPRVGGKCCSVTVDSRVYEMGAVMGTRDYATTLDLMDATDVQGGPIEGFHCYDLEGRPTDLFPRRQVPRLAWQVLVPYAWATQVRYRHVNDPGLSGLPRELSEPFAHFAKQHGLASLPVAFSPPFTAFGYGWFDEVPAAYVMKYIDMHMVEALVSPTRRLEWPDGVESLWSRLAAQNDVRTSTTVRRVTRGDTVRVQTDADELEFDTLILASPLHGALEFLDASPTEQRLFSQIRTYDYHVLLARISGLPEGSGLLPANFLAKRFGHALLWYHRGQGDPLYTVYVLSDGTMTPEEIERTCADDFEQLGARFEEVITTRRWRYFPHVTSDVMAAGFYDELEGLQGTDHTYYAGEIMSFATVEQCARYSRDLVSRFFDRVPAHA